MNLPSPIYPPPPPSRRTQWIGRLRVGLPLLAVGLVLLLFLWPVVGGFFASFGGAPQLANDRLSITQPRYSGLDNKGAAYALQAESATQFYNQPDTVVLQKPSAQLPHDVGTAPIIIDAASGEYHKEKKTMMLSGGVVVRDSLGNVMQTSAANADLVAGTAQSQQPVTGNGPDGQMQAAGFSMTEKGGVIMLHGPARVVLLPKQTTTTTGEP